MDLFGHKLLFFKALIFEDIGLIVVHGKARVWYRYQYQKRLLHQLEWETFPTDTKAPLKQPLGHTLLTFFAFDETQKCSWDSTFHFPSQPTHPNRALVNSICHFPNSSTTLRDASHNHILFSNHVLLNSSWSIEASERFKCLTGKVTKRKKNRNKNAGENGI